MCLPANHPVNIQATIAHTQPGDTADIVKNKISRFSISDSYTVCSLSIKYSLFQILFNH